MFAALSYFYLVNFFYRWVPFSYDTNDVLQCQLSVKSPQTPADGAEQGDVVCQEKLTHAVFDVQSVSFFSSWWFFPMFSEIDWYLLVVICLLMLFLSLVKCRAIEAEVCTLLKSSENHLGFFVDRRLWGYDLFLMKMTDFSRNLGMTFRWVNLVWPIWEPLG